MSKKAPTIKDVAQLAGVSVATVSRTMNNKGYLSEEVKRKVNHAMQQLNYVPNQLARSFNTKRSNVIGVIIPTIENPFFAELVYHIEKSAESYGLKLLLCNSLNEPEIEKKYLHMLIANQVDGIIVGTHNEEMEEYKLPNMPIVAVERYLNDKLIATICCDNYNGGKTATEFLIAQGHRHILCLTAREETSYPGHNRRVAYTNVMLAHGLEPIFIEIDEIDVYKRQQLIQSALEAYPQMDAIFATDDVFAVLAHNATQASEHLNSDIQIIGFDGTKLMRSLYPQLPSIMQPIDAMADAAVRTLLQLIEQEPVENIQTLPIKLYTPKA